MTYCIKCGKIVIPDMSLGYPSSYQCMNPECEEFEKPWSLEENKDSMDWCIRHIRQLEAAMEALLARLGDA